eukprot:gene35010-45320_t
MSLSKPLAEPAVYYQSDPRQLGSDSKKKNSALKPQLDEKISKYTCSSHYKTCSHGRGDVLGGTLSLILKFVRQRCDSSTTHGCCDDEGCGISGDHAQCSIDSGGARKKRKFVFCHPSSMPSSFKPGRKRRSPEKRFDYDWTINIDTGYLPDPKQTKLKLCKESLCFLYGISPNQIKRCAKKMKMQNTVDIRSIRVERNFNHRSYFGDEHSMEDICKIFDDNGVDVG